MDEHPRGTHRVGGAKIRRLQDRAHHPLGGNGMIYNIIRATGQHAAEILRPRAIDRAVDDDMTDALGAQLLWVWRDSEECVNLAVDKQLLRADFGAAGDPV